MNKPKKMPSLTKMEISELLAKDLSIQLNQAKELVDLFFDEIKTVLASGSELHFSGFGNFSLREKHSRPGRNPKTGEEVLVTERRVVTFKLGPKLKTRL